MTQKFSSTYIPKRNENGCPHKNWYMNFLAALCAVAKKENQCECLSSEERTATMQSISAANTTRRKKWTAVACGSMGAP